MDIRYFGALDPNLRKGWTEEDDAALHEAMVDENIDRFLLARRLGKSMDMVGDVSRAHSAILTSFPLLAFAAPQKN